MSADAADAAPACAPCRGTGRVRSSLGGEPHQVTCPWCEGAGRLLADHDAQATGPAERLDG